MKIKYLRHLGDYFLFLGLLAVVSLFFGDAQSVSAQYIPLPSNENFGNLPSASGDDAITKSENLVFAIYNNVKYIIGAIAVTFITYSGLMMIMSRGQEDVVGKQKTGILWGLLGLAIISMAESLAYIFEYTEGKGLYLTNYEMIAKSSIAFREEVFMVIWFIKYLIGSISVFFIVRAAYKLIIAGYSEEVIGKEKKNLVLGLFGLVLIVWSEVVVEEVFFKLDPNVARTSAPQPELVPARGVTELIGLTNFIVTFVGPFAVLSLIGGGIYYAISLGDDEKMSTGKKIITNSIIGILIIYGAFALVTTFIGGSIDYGEPGANGGIESEFPSDI